MHPDTLASLGRRSVGENTTFFGPVITEKGVKLLGPCFIGFPLEANTFVFKPDTSRKNPTVIGQGSVIKPFSIIFRGAKIGKKVNIEEYSLIGHKTKIGNYTIIVYGAKVYHEVEIGRECIISGFCCNGSKIGDKTTMMGRLIHRYTEHAIESWYDETKPHLASPNIGKNVIIGFDSIIIGDVTIGNNSRIGAKTIISSNIPSNTRIGNGVVIGSKVVIGRNVVINEGATIGKKSHLGSGAIISGNVPPGTVVKPNTTFRNCFKIEKNKSQK